MVGWRLFLIVFNLGRFRVVLNILGGKVVF